MAKIVALETDTPGVERTMNILTQPFCRTCDEYFVVKPYRMASAKYCSRRCRRINTPETLRLKKNRWNHANRQKVNRQNQVRVARWVSRHPEQARTSQLERGRKYAAAHRQERVAALRKRYWSDPVKWRAYKSAWAKRNADKVQASRRKRYANDPAYRLKCNAYARQREARKLNAKIGNLKEFLKQLATAKHHKCYWCHKLIPLGKIHLDHVMPLVKGGAHAAFNLVTACQSCNCHKQGQHPNQFIKNGQLILTF